MLNQDREPPRHAFLTLFLKLSASPPLKCPRDQGLYMTPSLGTVPEAQKEFGDDLVSSSHS